MDRDLSVSSIKPFQIAPDAAQANLVMIGPKAQFPDCLFRVMTTEMDGSRPVRMESLAELAKGLDERRVRPQLVIIDQSLWTSLEGHFADRIRLDYGATVAVAFHSSARLVQSMARHQVQGPISFLPMDLNIQSWLSIVQLLLTGYPFVPPDVAKALGRRPVEDSSDDQAGSSMPHKMASPEAVADPRFGKLHGTLTRREAEVLKLMAQGLQNKHIAEQLDLSEHTVKLHVHNVIFKLGATNRTDAAIRFHQQTRADGNVR